MPPEPSNLKRKRSLPKDWWAVASNFDAPDPPPQGEEHAPKNIERTSKAGAGRRVQQMPIARIRRKGKVVVDEGESENGQDRDGNGVKKAAKPLRMRRSSEADVVAAAELAAEVESDRKRKRERQVQREEKEVEKVNAREGQARKATGTKHKRNRSVAMDAEGDEAVNGPDEGATEPKKKRGRHSAKVRAEHIEQVAGEPQKRGRPVAPQVEKNRARRPAKDGTKQQSQSKMDAPNLGQYDTELVDMDKSMSRDRSSDTQKELQAVVESALNIQANAKKRGRRGRDTVDGYAPASRLAKPTKEDPATHSKAASHKFAAELSADLGAEKDLAKRANAKGPAPKLATEPVKAVTSTKVARQSKAASMRPASSGSLAKGEFDRTAHGRRSGTVIQVKAGTSSLAGDRPVPKNSGSTSSATNAKSSKISSIMPKIRPRVRTAEVEHSSEPQPENKKPSNGATSGAKRKNQEPHVENEAPPDPKRRRIGREAEQEPAVPTDKPPSYQHLAAVTRRVSRQKIDSTWSPLPSGCIEFISHFLQDLQRPIVVSLHDDTKRKEATRNMQFLSRKLRNKIEKGLPFPPAIRTSREEDFDFEKILDDNRRLESLLTPELHANKLLRDGIAQERTLLESQQESLVELEKNAKSEAAVRKDAGRKLHPLLLPRSESLEVVRLNIDIGLQEHHIFIPFTHIEDEDLQDIAKDLKGHLDTIGGNLIKVGGISQAISKSQAAVQATLFEHLAIDQYENVVLG